MRGHEVDGGSALLDVRQELRDPRRSGSAWAPHPQSGIDGLDRLCSQIVELEVCLLVGTFPESGEVGFVPDLEKPSMYFISSVPSFDVPDESIDEVAPTFRFRMRCVAVPIENAVL